MKRIAFLLLTWISTFSFAQVTTIPALIQKGYTGPITIVFNPNGGNRGMVGATACYAHTGITIGANNWQHANAQWRDGLDKYRMTKNADGNWELLITPNMYEFYGVDETTDITQLCFVFNDGPNGNKEGKMATGEDIFINLVDPFFTAMLTAPEDNLLCAANSAITITGAATEKAILSLSVNGEEVLALSDTTYVSYNALLGADNYEIVLTASNGEVTVLDTMHITTFAPKKQARPAGLELGITYDPQDPTKATLCTFAGANKVPNNPSVLVPAQAAYVLGDFNNWTISDEYQMNQDSCYFWIELNGLTPQQEYVFQYIVIRSDGKRVALSDAFSQKLVHVDDQWEPKTVNPQEYIPYPVKAEGGYCSVLQTGKTAYEWSEATLNFVRPDKNDLMIYELWVYDFTPSRSFAGVMQRLDYLQKLGVNAIELMPISEFDGNYNWGYGPNHYFAVDKAYGSSDDFKALVDSIHGRGMAVILDMVFNHATGNNPQNKLYPYGDDLKYNPWFNVEAPHSDNVYEDWNHDFPEVEKMFTRCLNYWLDEYKVDGFRMDLAHGFCGKIPNAAKHINHYYDYAIEPHNAYFILELWGDVEHQPLIDKGMLCWTGGDLANAYCQLAMGFFTGDNISRANQDGYVSYAESHDEERNIYKAKAFGTGGIKNDENACLKRVPLLVGMLTLLDGPHMLWMNEELGYDYSINSAKGASDLDSGHRTDIKMQPDELGWFSNANRMAAYETCSKIINLRTRIAPQYFTGTPVKSSLTGGKALRYIIWGEEGNMLVAAANFNTTGNASMTLPADGVWYDYLNETTVTGKNLNLGIGTIRILMQQPPTALEEAMTTPNLPTKVLLNGQVFINNNGTLYDLFGRRYE